MDILESGRILRYFTVNHYFLLINLSSTFFPTNKKQTAHCLNKILFVFLPKYWQIYYQNIFLPAPVILMQGQFYVPMRQITKPGYIFGALTGRMVQNSNNCFWSNFNSTVAQNFCPTLFKIYGHILWPTSLKISKTDMFTQVLRTPLWNFFCILPSQLLELANFKIKLIIVQKVQERSFHKQNILKSVLWCQILWDDLNVVSKIQARISRIQHSIQ